MHEGRNIFRKSAADLALALVWVDPGQTGWQVGPLCVSREPANVADEGFAPGKRRREQMNIGGVGEADKETTLSAGKDFAT